MRDPEVRSRLVESAQRAYATGELSDASSVHSQDQMPEFSELQVMRHAVKRNPMLTDLAAERRASPVEVMIDLAVESDFEQCFGRFTGWQDADLLTAMTHPHTVMTFSDSGAHVSSILGASIQTPNGHCPRRTALGIGERSERIPALSAHQSCSRAAAASCRGSRASAGGPSAAIRPPRKRPGRWRHASRATTTSSPSTV